jgi:hypothetical protein
MVASIYGQVAFSREFQHSILQLPAPQRFEVVQRLLHLADGKRLPAAHLQCNQALPEFQDLIRVQRVLGWALVWTVDVDRAQCTYVHPSRFAGPGADRRAPV